MTTKIYLWQKKSTISDHANASFLAAVDGNGDFYSRHMTITILSRQMRCTKDVVDKCIRRLKSPDYSYPLQRWSATKEYKLFSHTTEDFEIPLANYVADIESTIKTLKQKRTSDGLSKLVTTVPLLSGGLIDNESLLAKAVRCGIIEKMYKAAWNYIKTNRSHKELQMFEGMFPEQNPKTCFVNIYTARINSGIGRHRDHVSFCTVMQIVTVICALSDPFPISLILLFLLLVTVRFFCARNRALVSSKANTSLLWILPLYI
jgi:hypothetical protein